MCYRNISCNANPKILVCLLLVWRCSGWIGARSRAENLSSSSMGLWIRCVHKRLCRHKCRLFDVLARVIEPCVPNHAHAQYITRAQSHPAIQPVSQPSSRRFQTWNELKQATTGLVFIISNSFCVLHGSGAASRFAVLCVRACCATHVPLDDIAAIAFGCWRKRWMRDYGMCARFITWLKIHVYGVAVTVTVTADVVYVCVCVRERL